jgi:diguanylate cyclase (GGDEF)-like protein
MIAPLRHLRNRLFIKQAIASVAIAFVIGSVLAALQIYYDMLAEKERIESLGANRLEPALDTLTLAAFRLDESVASDVANGLLLAEAVTRITVRDDFGDVLTEVSKPRKQTPLLGFGFLFGREPIITRKNLTMEPQNRQVGTVELAVDPLIASRDFSRRTGTVLIGGVVKSLLLSLALMVYFYRTATQRINQLNERYNATFNTRDASKDHDEINNLSASLEAWAEEKTLLVTRLDRMAKRVKLAASVGDIGIWEFDVETDDLRWDDTMHAIYELPKSRFKGHFTDWRSCVHPDDLPDSEAKFNDIVRTGDVFEDEFRIITPDGTEKHIEARAQLVTFDDGKRRVIGVNFDVTDRFRRESELIEAHAAADYATAQMRHDATHDSLTDLHNRRALDAHMRMLSETLTDGIEVTFLQLDLDRFKSINDAFGHSVGDFVLKEAGRFLKEMETGEVFVARIGGDEFSLVISGPDTLQRAEEAARQIIEKCAQPLEFDNLILHYGASVGIAVGTAAQLSNLHENADIALYVAKQSMGGRFAVFDTKMRVEAERHKRVADGLRVALQEDQLVVHFQPKLHARSRQVAGLEALVRWQHPKFGLMSPAEFLPIAEEIGLEKDIDRKVLQLALETAQRLSEAGLSIPHVAVNVSLQRLKDPGLLDHLDQIGPFPCKLVFEVLETVDLDAVHKDLRWVLDGLRERGVSIEIDDFGTGHASITSILSLQPDGLKLDRSLVAGVKGMPPPSEDLLMALVDIGRASDISITAEGIESVPQAEMLERLGCDLLQGYLFAKPMSEADLIDWLGNGSPRRPQREQLGV